MLPEKSIEQLKKLRQQVKGKDINDKVSKDETKLPNVYWMDNPIDGGRIQSYEEYTKKDNKKQTTTFKSKLVNKPLVNQQLTEKMSIFDEMREIYNKYGIDIHSVPNNIQNSLNRLIKDFIKLKNKK